MLTVVTCLAVTTAACSKGEPPAHRSVIGDAPGRGDSLAKLTRAVLTARDPVKAMQAMNCETGRLIRQFGPSVAESIRVEVLDTLYSWKDWPARIRIEEQLAHRVIRYDCAKPTLIHAPTQDVERQLKSPPF
jgi:hypothetical protein